MFLMFVILKIFHLKIILGRMGKTPNLQMFSLAARVGDGVYDSLRIGVVSLLDDKL